MVLGSEEANKQVDDRINSPCTDPFRCKNLIHVGGDTTHQGRREGSSINGIGIINELLGENSVQIIISALPKLILDLFMR